MSNRRVHNPEGLTAHQIGEADGWRCLYQNEPIPADAEWFDQMEWKPVRGCGAPAGPRDHLTYRTKRSKPADQEECDLTAPPEHQEAERLARKIWDKYRSQTGGVLGFDDLLFAHRQGWIAAAKLFLEEVPAWQQRAESAEKEIAGTTSFLENLRRTIEAAYRVKHGKGLTYEKGWGWEALAFIKEELARPTVVGDGIDGTLVEAGTLESSDDPDCEDFRGLVIKVSYERLREAKRIPLYREVRVVEVAP